MFTPTDIAELVRAARLKPKNDYDDLRRTLADRLTEIATSFLRNRLWQQQPPASKVVKQLRAVNRAAESLLAKLPRADDAYQREARYRLTAQAAVKIATPELMDLAAGTERLRATTNAVEDIAAWSQAAMLREAARKGRRPGRRGDEAMQQLISNLNGVWIDYWERLPGASHKHSTDDIGGPYVRFVLGFLQRVQGHMTPVDFEADRGLRAALRSSPEAIRERLRATGVSRLYHGGESRLR